MNNPDKENLYNNIEYRVSQKSAQQRTKTKKHSSTLEPDILKKFVQFDRRSPNLDFNT